MDQLALVDDRADVDNLTALATDAQQAVARLHQAWHAAREHMRRVRAALAAAQREARQPRPRKWTRTTIAQAIQAFHGREGRWPENADFVKRMGLPRASTVRPLYGTLAAARRAAGMPNEGGYAGRGGARPHRPRSAQRPTPTQGWASYGFQSPRKKEVTR